MRQKAIMTSIEVTQVRDNLIFYKKMVSENK